MGAASCPARRGGPPAGLAPAVGLTTFRQVHQTQPAGRPAALNPPGASLPGSALFGSAQLGPAGPAQLGSARLSPIRPTQPAPPTDSRLSQHRSACRRSGPLWAASSSIMQRTCSRQHHVLREKRSVPLKMDAARPTGQRWATDGVVPIQTRRQSPIQTTLWRQAARVGRRSRADSSP